MIRALCLIGGLTGATGLSQMPEFSQQYLQRLAGQVDELTRQAVEFDETALADGMGREEMLQAMAATPLVASQEALWRRTFGRHARLSENLMILRDAAPLERLTLLHRMADPATVRAVWEDFTPAMPLGMAGAASAGAGFLGGWAVFAALIGVFVWPFRRMTAAKPKARTRKTPVVKSDPPLTRPALVPDSQGNRPRLSGVQR